MWLIMLYRYLGVGDAIHHSPCPPDALMPVISILRARKAIDHYSQSWAWPRGQDPLTCRHAGTTIRCVANVTVLQPSSEIALPALIGKEMRRWTAAHWKIETGGPGLLYDEQGYCVHGAKFWTVRAKPWLSAVPISKLIDSATGMTMTSTVYHLFI